MIEPNSIIQGDCLEIMKDIPDKSVDLVLTDPPYGVLKKVEWDNIKLEEFTTKWWKLCQTKLKENNSVYIFWSQKYLKLGLEIFNPKRVLIWWHSNLLKPTSNMFNYSYDPIFYINNSGIFNGKFCNSDTVDVLKFAIPQSNFIDKKKHPCQKPIALIQKLITISSNPNDLILDPFLGSGTTAVACAQLKRRYIGIEINEEYCKIARGRVATVENQGTIF